MSTPDTTSTAPAVDHADEKRRSYSVAREIQSAHFRFENRRPIILRNTEQAEVRRLVVPAFTEFWLNRTSNAGFRGIEVFVEHEAEDGTTYWGVISAGAFQSI